MGSSSKAKIQKKNETIRKTNHNNNTNSNNSKTPQIRKSITAKVDTGKVRRKPKKRTQRSAILSPHATLTRLKQSRFELIRELDSIREILKDEVYPASSTNRLFSGEILKRYRSNSTSPAPLANDSRSWGVIFGRKMDLHQQSSDFPTLGPHSKAIVFDSMSDLGDNKSRLTGAEGSIVNVQQFAEQFKNLCERFKKHAPPAELEFLEHEQKRISSMLNKVDVNQHKPGTNILKDRFRQNRHVGAQTASPKNGLGRSDDLKSFKLIKTNKNYKDQPKSDLVLKTDAVPKQQCFQKPKGIIKQKRLVGSDMDSLTDGSTTESIYNYNKYTMKRNDSLASSINTPTSEDSYRLKPAYRNVQPTLIYPIPLKTSTSFATTEEEEDDGINELSEAGSEEASIVNSDSEVTSDSSSSQKEVIPKPKKLVEKLTNPYEQTHNVVTKKDSKIDTSENKPQQQQQQQRTNITNSNTNTKSKSNTAIAINKKQAVKELKAELQNIKLMKALTNSAKRAIKCYTTGNILEPIEEESAESLKSKMVEDKDSKLMKKVESVRKVRFADENNVDETEKEDIPKEGKINASKVTLKHGEYDMDLCGNVLSDSDKKVKLTKSVVKWTEISRKAADAALERRNIQCPQYKESNTEIKPDILPSGDHEFHLVKYVEPFNYTPNVTSKTETQCRESGDHDFKPVNFIEIKKKSTESLCTESRSGMCKLINSKSTGNAIEEIEDVKTNEDGLEIVASKSSLEPNSEPDKCSDQKVSAYELSIRKGDTDLVSCEEEDSDDDWRYTKMFKYTKAISAGNRGLSDDTEFCSQQLDDENHTTTGGDVNEIDPILIQTMEKLYKNQIELNKKRNEYENENESDNETENEVDIRTAFQKDVKRFALNSSKLKSICAAVEDINIAMSKSEPALRYDELPASSMSKQETESLDDKEPLVDSQSSAILPLDCEFFLPSCPTMEELAWFCHETLESLNIGVDPVGCSEILEPIFDISPLRSELSVEAVKKIEREREADVIEEIKRSSDTSMNEEDDLELPTVDDQRSHIDISRCTSNSYEFVEETVGHDADFSTSSSEQEPYIPINLKSGYAWERLGVLEKSQIDSQQLLKNLENSIENMKSGLLKLAEACERTPEKPQTSKRAKKTKKVPGLPTLTKKSIIPITAWSLKLKDANRDIEHTVGMKSELEAFYQELMSEQPTSSQDIETFKQTEMEASSALRLTGDIIARAYEERYAGGNPSFDDMHTSEKFDKCETEQCDLGEAGTTNSRHKALDVVKAEAMALKDDAISRQAPLMYMPLLCVPKNVVHKENIDSHQSSSAPITPRNYQNIFQEKLGKFTDEIYPAKLEPTDKSGYDYFCSKIQPQLDIKEAASVIDIRKQEESCQMKLFENPYEMQENERTENLMLLQKNSKDMNSNIPNYTGCPCMYDTYKDVINPYKSSFN